MYKRSETIGVQVGPYQIGGNNKVWIQSMTTTKTANIKSTIDQINDLFSNGCEIVRVAVLGTDDVNALPTIVKNSPIPVVADIHFNYKFAIAAADANVAKIRINPGNIGDEKNTIQVVNKCKDKNIPIRIGINSGSLPIKLVEKYGWTPKCMIAAAEEHINILEKLNFSNIILSLKATHPKMAIEAYTLAANKWKYPLHLGITESGSLLNGAIKSSAGLGVLLNEGIGNTIRISLSTDPVQEVKVAKKLLNTFDLYEEMVDIISCPTCGRLEYDMLPIVKEIEKFSENLKFNYKIAILGCAVNGPGEAKQADIGIAGGKNGGIIFKKGKIIATCKQDELVLKLKTIIMEDYNLFNNKKNSTN